MGTAQSWARAGALSGTAFVVLLIVSGFLPGTPPEINDPGTEIASFFHEQRLPMLISGVVSGLSIPIFLIFAAAIWSISAVNTDQTPLRIIFLGAAILAMAMSSIGTVATLTLAYLSQSAMDPSATQMVYGLQVIAYTFIGVALVVFIPVTSRILQQIGVGGQSTFWLGWLVAALMLASQFSVFFDDGFLQPGGTILLSRDLPFSLWLIGVSWAVFRFARTSAFSLPEAAIST